MENPPQNQSLTDPKKDTNSLTIGQAVDLVNSVLDRMSQKDALAVLKAVGGIRNLKTDSVFRPLGPGGPLPRSPAKQVSSASGPGHPKAENRDPKVIELKAQLSLLRGRIKDAAKEYPGGILPPEHELILSQSALLASIVEARSSFRRSKSTKTNQSPPPSFEEAKGAPQK